MGLAFSVENIGNDFSLVHMVLNTLDFLIILMTFACKYDNISVLGIVHAIFNCISAVRHRLITMFGAGGNRPKVRRYEMGETSGRLSDLSVVTEDNSRFEDVMDIIESALCA